VQLVEQRLGLLQIERVEAFGEPAIRRSKQLASLLRLPCQAAPCSLPQAYPVVRTARRRRLGREAARGLDDARSSRFGEWADFSLLRRNPHRRADQLRQILLVECLLLEELATAEGSGGARAWCDKAIWLAQEAETFFTKIDSVPITFNVLAAIAARPRALSGLNP
jgi:hypothetical protein